MMAQPKLQPNLKRINGGIASDGSRNKPQRTAVPEVKVRESMVVLPDLFILFLVAVGIFAVFTVGSILVSVFFDDRGPTILDFNAPSITKPLTAPLEGALERRKSRNPHTRTVDRSMGKVGSKFSDALDSTYSSIGNQYRKIVGSSSAKNKPIGNAFSK